MIGRFDLAEEKRIEKTVFIKAPRAMSYSNIVKVIDGLKGAGASPIGLALDGLD
jgi:biopolymer transport protein ExbD